MYEFIETATGWRVFWGIDPLANERQAARDERGDATSNVPVILPFYHPEDVDVVPRAG